MKKTLTKNEAREWLRDKYVPVYSLEDAFKALKIFENIGFKIDKFADGDVDDEFPWHVLPDDEDEVGICWSGYRVHAMDKETFELYLSDLLAIEIVEEPRLKCVPGCKPLTGNETIHHADCPYYPESLTKIHNDHRALFEEAVKLLERCEPEIFFGGRLHDDVEQFLKANRP